VIEQKDLLTASEAMREFGYNNAYLIRLIKSGDLEGFKLGNQWVIRRSSLEAYKAHPKPRGGYRGRKAAS
jgi:excisionase family DNA binding protein